MTAASDDTAARVRTLIEEHMLDVAPRTTYDPTSVRVNAATLGEALGHMLDQARAEALAQAALRVDSQAALFDSVGRVEMANELRNMAAAIRTLQGGSDAG